MAGIDKKTLAAANGYTRQSLEGAGALKGNDGFSPIVTTKQVEDGTEVSITDSTHTETFVVKNGVDIEGNKNYENLENKPSINNVTLEKNKTFEQLGMVPLTNIEIMQIINRAINQTT